VSFFGYWTIILFVPRGLEDRNVQVDHVIYQRTFPRKQRFRLRDDSSSLRQMHPGGSEFETASTLMWIILHMHRYEFVLTEVKLKMQQEKP